MLISYLHSRILYFELSNAEVKLTNADISLLRSAEVYLNSPLSRNLEERVYPFIAKLKYIPRLLSGDFPFAEGNFKTSMMFKEGKSRGAGLSLYC